MNGAKRRQIWIWGLGTALVLGLLTWKAPGVCSLLLASFIIAYVCAPLVDFLQRRRMPRGLASALVLVVVLLLFLGLLTLLVPVLVSQGSRLAQRLPDALAYIQSTLVPWVESKFGVDIPDSGAGWVDRLRQVLPRLGGVVGSVGQLALATFGGVLGIVGAVANLVLIPFVCYYLLCNYHALWPNVERLIPPRHAARVRAIKEDIDASLSGFVRGQLTVALILGCLLATGLSIVGIEGAIVIGLLSGLLNMIPYVGTGTGLTLSILMALMKFSGLAPVIGVLVVFAITQSLEGYLITPRIVGKRVGLPPAAVIVAVLAGGEIFGFVGILLAVPMAAILKVLLRVVREVYLASDSYEGGAAAAGVSPQIPARAATPAAAPPAAISPGDPPPASGTSKKAPA